MFYQLDLLALLLTPVMAYLAAALLVSLVGKRDKEKSITLLSTTDSLPRRS